MDARVHNVFAGHLRAIVGSMTVEEMIRDREKLTQLTRQSSGTEMEKLGLIVDSIADIYSVSAGEIEPPPATWPAERAACFVGTARVTVGVMGLLDLARVTKLTS